MDSFHTSERLKLVGRRLILTCALAFLPFEGKSQSPLTIQFRLNCIFESAISRSWDLSKNDWGSINNTTGRPILAQLTISSRPSIMNSSLGIDGRGKFSIDGRTSSDYSVTQKTSGIALTPIVFDLSTSQSEAWRLTLLHIGPITLPGFIPAILSPITSNQTFYGKCDIGSL